MAASGIPVTRESRMGRWWWWRHLPALSDCLFLFANGGLERKVGGVAREARDCWRAGQRVSKGFRLDLNYYFPNSQF